MNGETVKLGIPGAAQREALAKQMVPLQRLGTADDAAGAMLLLASPYASYISAQVTLNLYVYGMSAELRQVSATAALGCCCHTVLLLW